MVWIEVLTMLWSEVESRYGKRIANKMKHSKYLRGITITLRDDGRMDIPEHDINLAYKDVTGKRIHPLEWD